MSYAGLGHTQEDTVLKTSSGVTFRVFTPEGLKHLLEKDLLLPSALADGEITIPVETEYMSETFPPGMALLVPKRDNAAFGSSVAWIQKHIADGNGILGSDGKAGQSKFVFKNLPAPTAALLESMISQPHKFMVPTRDLGLVARLSAKDPQAVVLAEPSGGWDTSAVGTSSEKESLFPLLAIAAGLALVVWAADSQGWLTPRKARR